MTANELPPGPEETVAGFEQAIQIIRDTQGWTDPRTKLWVIGQLEAEAERHRNPDDGFCPHGERWNDRDPCPEGGRG